MARHNREGRGADQRGYDYDISYQPDWLHLVKVARTLESGRQSTKTLFRNPAEREAQPGPRVRTHIVSKEQNLDFEISVSDPREVVRRVIVETVVPGSTDEEGTVVFIIEDKSAPRSDDEDDAE
jgi:hypothetical protein